MSCCCCQQACLVIICRRAMPCAAGMAGPQAVAPLQGSRHWFACFACQSAQGGARSPACPPCPLAWLP